MRESKTVATEESMIQAGFRFATSLANHPEDAEDLVQQACFRVISKKGKLQSQSYLFKTIRNLHYDALRRKKILVFESVEAKKGNTDVEMSVSPNLGARIDLESKLDLLAAEEREVLYLNCVEGYTAAELATTIGKPRSTVLNILSRAKKKLMEAGERGERRQLIHG